MFPEDTSFTVLMYVAQQGDYAPQHTNILHTLLLTYAMINSNMVDRTRHCLRGSLDLCVILGERQRGGVRHLSINSDQNTSTNLQLTVTESKLYQRIQVITNAQDKNKIKIG